MIREKISNPSKARWTMALVTFLVFVDVVVEVVMAGQPSVQYVESAVIGNFFYVKDKTFKANNAHHVFDYPKSCTCRSMCLSFGSRCQSWSTIRLNNGNKESFQCLIADQGPDTFDVIDDEGASFFFKETSIKGNYTWQDDLLLYVALEDTLFFEEAQQHCQKIPGHRLIILKSPATYEFFVNLKDQKVPQWLVNLKKESTTSFVWGDGTVIEANEYIYENIVGMDQPIFRLRDGVLDDTLITSGPFRILCQANPRGIEW